MLIDKARQIKVGDTVNHDADRGDPAGSGIVSHIGSGTNKNIYGREFLWITLSKGGVWPSNRLS